MRILRNNDILERQSDNYINGELSNVAMVVQSPQVLVDYYSIDADQSMTIQGINVVNRFISDDSTVVYNKIEGVPISGIDNLVFKNDYDSEIGLDAEFTSSGVMFPNTVTPKPNDCFIIKTSAIPCLFTITKIENTLVRNNPFVEITFMLLSQDRAKIAQLDKQVKDVYVLTVTSIGSDKNLVINKAKFFELKDLVSSYIDLTELYKSLFYDESKAAFVYRDVYDESTNSRYNVIDVMLWKYLYENGIVVYDSVITYANNNYDKSVQRVFIDTPPPYIDNYKYKQSVLYRILHHDKVNFDEYRFPQTYTENPQLTRFSGVNLLYIESYTTVAEDHIILGDFTIFDDEFVDRIKHDIKYSTNADKINPSLRNAIIDMYYHRTIDFNNIEIHDLRNKDNYYLIPLLLNSYKRYIAEIK